MMWSSSDTDARRMKIGVAFLIVGALLLIWAWASWAFRTSAVNAQPLGVSRTLVAEEVTEGAAGDNPERIRALPRLLMYVILLVVVCLFGGYALIRFTRRYRAAAERCPIIPTPSNNLWEKHRLPDDDADA